MAIKIKTTIDERGVIQEDQKGGSDTTTEIDVDVKLGGKLKSPLHQPVLETGADEDVTVSQPVTWVYPDSAAGMTASLPTITSASVGKQFLILKNSGSNPCLVSGAQGITEGGSWDYAIDSSRAFCVMAASGSAGVYYWHVLYNTELSN